MATEEMPAVKLEILCAGYGTEKPQTGDQVQMHYTGTLLSGEKFDSSRDRGQPFSCQIGVGQVIKGWDEVVMGMVIGQRVKATIPWQKAYGESGSPPTIPGQADLIFDMELLDFGDATSGTADEKLTKASAAKETGTKAFKDGNFSCALQQYSRGYDIAQDVEEKEEEAKAIAKSCAMNATQMALKLEDFSDAIDWAEKVLSIDPDNVKSLYRKGLAATALKDFQEATAALTAANKLEPGNKDVRAAYADAVAKHKAEKAKAKAMESGMAAAMSKGLYKEKACVEKPVEHKLDELPKVFMDVKIGDAEAQRITMVLYSDTVPKTAENFKQLCTGESGNCTTKPDQPRCFKGSKFHRVISGFMMQGGDFTNGNGTGGESIYGEKFADEKFVDFHTKKHLLSMANAGPNTNGSQFFITFGTPAHLDNKHVVFGEVVDGFEVVDAVEKCETGDSDVPKEPIEIVDCGVL